MEWNTRNSRIAAAVFLASGLIAGAAVYRARRKVALDAVLFSGPSGVGKGTIISKLLQDFGGKLGLTVSHTTREPREGEIDGFHYHFVSKETMLSMIGDGKFLEVCEVHGNFYGTSLKALEAVRATGKTPILEIDVKGAKKIREEYPKLNILFTFVQPPTKDDLASRIVKRDGENAKKLQVRLETAEFELNFVKEHPKMYDVVITNDNLDRAYAEVKSILKAKKCI